MHASFVDSALGQWLAARGRTLEDFTRMRINVVYDPNHPRGTADQPVGSGRVAGTLAWVAFEAQPHTAAVVLDEAHPAALKLLAQALEAHAGIAMSSHLVADGLPKATDTVLDVRPLAQRWMAEAALTETIIDHDGTPGADRGYRDARWAVFQLSDAFAAQPCERAVAEHLHAQFSAGKHFASMTFGQYYAWFRRSDAQFPAGVPTASVHAALQAQRQALVAQPEAAQRRQVMRALQVHPAHHEAAWAAYQASPVISNVVALRPRPR